MSPSNESDVLLTDQASGESTADQVPAWEQVANGRYMPRRIRGSCIGRELG